MSLATRSPAKLSHNRFLTVFAFRAVIGDEGLIFQVLKGAMDAFEFVANDGEDALFVGAGDADANVGVVVVGVFDNFGAGAADDDDAAVFPDEALLFNVAMEGDDEAGEDVFGFEGVVVGEDEVVVGVPGGLILQGFWEFGF